MAKIVNIKDYLQGIIDKAKENDRLAQHEIYKRYHQALMSVCRLYISDLCDAEEVLVKSFFKIFIHIKNYKNDGHFYAWMRKIVVNQCIDFLRGAKNKVSFAEWNDHYENILDDNDEVSLSAEEIQEVLDELPTGARAVFNLYVFEDYSHKAIAEELNISEGTSKSQLFYAKKVLKNKLNTLNNGKRFQK